MKEEDLNQFKEILLEKRQMILDNNLEHRHSMEYLREHSLDEADQAAMRMRNILDGSIFEFHNEELEYIDAALQKIEDGQYGICEMCDEPIAIQRLKAKPHAKYCIVCREIVEKTKRDL